MAIDDRPPLPENSNSQPADEQALGLDLVQLVEDAALESSYEFGRIRRRERDAYKRSTEHSTKSQVELALPQIRRPARPGLLHAAYAVIHQLWLEVGSGLKYGNLAAQARSSSSATASGSAVSNGVIGHVDWDNEARCFELGWNLRSEEWNQIKSWDVAVHAPNADGEMSLIPSSFRIRDDGSTDPRFVVLSTPHALASHLASPWGVSVRCLAAEGGEWLVEIDVDELTAPDASGQGHGG